MKALGQLSLALAQRQKTKIMVEDKDWISFLNMPYYNSNIWIIENERADKEISLSIAFDKKIA